MTPQPDYSTWLTKEQAARAIGVTTKSVERFVQAGQIQQGRWQRDGRGPLLAVYHPDDVARIAKDRQPGPAAPFLVPTSDSGLRTPDLPANGNGHQPSTALEIPPAPPIGSGQEMLHAIAVALRTMSETSQTSQTLFLTLDQAARVSGLSRTYLQRQIKAGTLRAQKDRGWKIRRKDLEQL